MPWQHTPQTRRHDAATYGTAWRKLRQRVLDRDQHRCVMAGCGRRTQLTVDHRIPVSQGGTDDLSNLRTLCAQHHREKTAQEGNGWRTTPSDPQAKPTTTW